MFMALLSPESPHMKLCHVCMSVLWLWRWGRGGAAEPSRFSQKVPMEGPLPQLTRSSALPQSRHLNPQGSRALSPHLCGAALSSPVVSALPSCKAIVLHGVREHQQARLVTDDLPWWQPLLPFLLPAPAWEKRRFLSSRSPHFFQLLSRVLPLLLCPDWSLLGTWAPPGLPVTRGCVWGVGGCDGVCFPTLSS